MLLCQLSVEPQQNLAAESYTKITRAIKLFKIAVEEWGNGILWDGEAIEIVRKFNGA